MCIRDRRNTYPSTHVTLVVALAVAVVLLAPTRPRWLVPVLGAVVVLTMLGNVTGYAHRPSDTVGALLLAMSVALAVRAVLGGPRRRPDRRA